MIFNQCVNSLFPITAQRIKGKYLIRILIQIRIFTFLSRSPPPFTQIKALAMEPDSCWLKKMMSFMCCSVQACLLLHLQTCKCGHEQKKKNIREQLWARHCMSDQKAIITPHTKHLTKTYANSNSHSLRYQKNFWLFSNYRDYSCVPLFWESFSFFFFLERIVPYEYFTLSWILHLAPKLRLFIGLS